MKIFADIESRGTFIRKWFFRAKLVLSYFSCRRCEFREFFSNLLEIHATSYGVTANILRSPDCGQTKRPRIVEFIRLFSSNTEHALFAHGFAR